jgi:hypothetical protein
VDRDQEMEIDRKWMLNLLKFLPLAVWKACCLMSVGPDDGIFNFAQSIHLPTQTIYETYATDTAHPTSTQTHTHTHAIKHRNTQPCSLFSQMMASIAVSSFLLQSRELYNNFNSIWRHSLSYFKKNGNIESQVLSKGK